MTTYIHNMKEREKSIFLFPRKGKKESFKVVYALFFGCGLPLQDWDCPVGKTSSSVLYISFSLVTVRYSYAFLLETFDFQASYECCVRVYYSLSFSLTVFILQVNIVHCGIFSFRISFMPEGKKLHDGS